MNGFYFFIFAIIGAIIIFLIITVKKWIHYYRIIRFRERLKPGIYVQYKKFGKIETGYVTRVWRDKNLVQVRTHGITFKLEYHEVFP